MNKIIYDSGKINHCTGFYITHERNGYYVHGADIEWAAVTPEKLREAADAIERQRDHVLFEFEDDCGDAFLVKLDAMGGVIVEPVRQSCFYVKVKCDQLGELIGKVINAKETSSV